MITQEIIANLKLFCRNRFGIGHVYIIGDERARVIEFANSFRDEWNTNHSDQLIAHPDILYHRLFNPPIYMAQMKMNGAVPSMSDDWPFSYLPNNSWFESEQISVTLTAEGDSISDVMFNLYQMCIEITERVINGMSYFEDELSSVQPTVTIGPDRKQHWSASISLRCPVITPDSYCWMESPDET